jgi:fucose 4-O-acetylase-like acetyltransferase
MGSPYIFLAQTNPALEKIEKIPHAFWLKLAIVIVGLILFVIVLRKILSINKFVMGGIIFIGGGLIWFNWLYYRTEPKFLSPFFDKIAPFFPTAGAYDTKQSSAPVK